MKIAVINGSPKGKYSITLQTVLYLERKFPEHTFEILHAGQRIKALEKDFGEAERLMESSDAILFSYPVYTFLCPSQLHRFISLLKKSGVCLDGKFVTQISTSKHFYDVTAHKYIEENVLDLGMRYVRGLSADMEDLLTEKGRREAEQFFERFLWAVKENIAESRTRGSEDFRPVEATLPLRGCDQRLSVKD
ncbi:MAG: NAD(P)H-dependent oxidoreductase, partial [Spirochaetales bacterium]|nr:NAD(P)H-dependent oxidoreductase [Spirochaetales bacterium]